MLTIISNNYSRIFLFILFLFTSTITFSQKHQTKEVKLAYSNGIGVFEVCLTNPTINFDEKKEYYWYSEISGASKIKSTEGGCGGNLLHGKERFFNNKGDLILERTYNLGLQDGESKYWDSASGKLSKIYRFVNGSCEYQKVKVESGWYEEFGKILTDGYTRRFYDEINSLTTEYVFKSDRYLTTEYFPYSKKIKSQYSTVFWCDTCNTGKYIFNYENGNRKVEGHYSDSLPNVRVGTWKWYKESGAFDDQEMYKQEIQTWPNGEWRMSGGYFYDTDSKKWLKRGTWNYYDETGKLLYRKNFEYDQEVN